MNLSNKKYRWNVPNRCMYYVVTKVCLQQLLIFPFSVLQTIKVKYFLFGCFLLLDEQSFTATSHFVNFTPNHYIGLLFQYDYVTTCVDVRLWNSLSNLIPSQGPPPVSKPWKHAAGATSLCANRAAGLHEGCIGATPKQA